MPRAWSEKQCRPGGVPRRARQWAAQRVVAADEIGKREGVTILGQWGEVPDDFAESLQG